MVVFTAFSVFQLIAAVIVCSFALIIFVGSKKPSSRAFLVLLLFIIIWMFASSVLPPTAWIDYAFRFDDYLGNLVAISFFYFCLRFPEDTEVQPWITWSIILIALAFIPLHWSGLIEAGVYYVGGAEGWYSVNGTLWPLYEASFIGFTIAGLYVLFQKYRHVANEKTKKDLGFMFWGTIVSIIPIILLSLVLPDFGFSNLDWFSPFTTLMSVSIIFYSILRYQQMDVKAVASEVFVLVMAIVLFVNIFLGESIFGTIGKVSIFLAFVLLGYLFIRSIIKEVLQKEQLEDLNENLNEKVAEQTTEIRASYEAEKKARVELEKANEELKELDKRKTEFLSVVAHQLRTPLSGIKWAITMLLHSTTDPLSDSQRRLLTSSQVGNERMITIVNQMLHAARIGESGIAEITLGPTDFIALVSDVVSEARLTATEHNITVIFTHDDPIPSLMLDREMVRLAVQNLVENAIKYSRSSGSILIKVELKGTQVQFSIADTGIGIPADQQNSIFARFLRAKNAIAADPNGNGLGLFITKSILEGHGGKIWFTSKENKGTTFYFTLNL